MGITYQKMAVVAGAISLGLGLLEVSPAQATSLNWGVSFFDHTGAQVGDGEFSYDPGATTFVQTSPDIPSSVPPQGFHVSTAIDRFSATVLGVSWQNTSGLSWLDAAEGLKQQQFNKSPVPNIVNGWLAGNPDTGALALNGGASQTGNWGGSWLQYIPVGYPNSTSGQGSWIASLKPQAEGAPEPATVLGAVTFGLGCLLRKKLTPAKKS